MLLHAVLNWFLGALALWLVARIIPGIEVRDFGSALIATLIIGVVNALVGPILKLLGLPFIILTLGLFLLVIDAALLKRGGNELQLTVPAGDVTTGVVYDYLRLELKED